jgi:predicted ATPase
MGIHTGPAELRGGDYYGTSVNRAARIMSVAHGGQVVISLAAQELARGDGLEVLDLGDHRLKDLGEPERIFQVVDPELEREFPPLRSLDRYATNLPTQVTSFVGRDHDVDRVVELLGEARLVTLAGTGGVGKTRLAVQVAAEVLPRFAGGAWFCELAAADDAEAMAQVVASTLGSLQHPGLSLAASIVEYLKVRQLLLVLDNCEHVLDDASEFAAAVVQRCPNVAVLATSREALDVPGEHVVRVRSLATPEASASDGDLIGSAAVRLFHDRAGDFGADLGWDDRQWAAVGDICRRVDGIPLAIELAAARTVSMNPVDVAGHLDERFRLLTGRRRGQIERHQTLRATVEWSYHLLGDDERLVFDRLGTFAGSFDAAAAIAVASGDELDSWSVTDALASLVAKSMVGTETGPDGAIRYTMLETLRQYARERLDETVGTDRVRRAMTRHLARVAEDAGAGATGPDDLAWLARIRADVDNIRAAVGWALDAEDTDDRELGLSILGSLEWMVEGASDLGLGALAARAATLAEHSAPRLRSPVLTLAAMHYWHIGDLAEARRLAGLACEDGIVTTSINPLSPLVAVVVIEMTAGNQTLAFEIADETRAHFGLVSEFEATRTLSAFSTFEAMAGRIDAARADADQALQLAHRVGNRALLAQALNGRAWALQRDDPGDALAAAEQFLDLARETGVARNTVPGVLALAAGLRARLGDDHGALPALHDAVVIARDDGTLPQAGAALTFALNPLCRIGKPAVAAILIGGLERGALAGVAGFPGTAESRVRTLARIQDALGEEKTAQLIDYGAGMTYDDFIAYAIEQLAA